MIERLLPAYVEAVDTFTDVGEQVLLAEERAQVQGAVASRIREYATVRWAARECLTRLGEPPGPLLTGERGAPQWPGGYVGSMTHCAGYRAAAVAPADLVDGIGIDAEPDEPLPDGVLASIASATERAHLAALAPGVRWDRLLFSAKEAFYKVWYPRMGVWLGFDDAEAGFTGGPVSGEFWVRPCAGGARRARREHADLDLATGFPTLTGLWLADRGVLVTAIAAAAGSLPPRPGEPVQRGRTVTGTL